VYSLNFKFESAQVPCLTVGGEYFFEAKMTMFICCAGVWIWMWAAAKRTTLALRSVFHPHPPRSRPSVCPWWQFGCLGRGRGRQQQTPHCPSLCLLPPSPPCSSLQRPRCPGYLCHGNCAGPPAQTQIPPLVSLFASMMTQQFLQGFPRPPFSILSDAPCHREAANANSILGLTLQLML